MKQSYGLIFRWKAESRIFLLVCFVVANGIFIANAQAQPIVTVKILFESAADNGCEDLGGRPDIYFRATIDDTKESSIKRAMDFNIGPQVVNYNHELSANVDFSRGTIRIKLGQWDTDPFPFEDAHCDINPGGGRDLNLFLNLATCQISGDLNGNCDTSIIVKGDRRPEFFSFKIEVVEQPRAPDLTLRCLHTPIWPQPGDTITIIAEALDGNGDNISKQPVDDIEIWADNIDKPIATSAANSATRGAGTFSVKYTPADGATEILYRCRAKDRLVTTVEEEIVSTGWRRVQIGQPARGKRAVGIINTGTQNSRVDIVFIPDKDNYKNGGAKDPKFLNDVSDVITDAYYAGSSKFRQAGLLFLQEQDMINFWIALNTGDADIVKNKCTLKPPKNWSSAYSFADAGAIVHTDFFRDCASPDRHIFSSEPASVGTFLHEMGHSPFGLADEYCCDGAYFQNDPFPNLYKNKTDCQNDPLSFRVRDACQAIRGNACKSGTKAGQECKPNAIGQDMTTCGTASPQCGPFTPRFNAHRQTPPIRLDRLSTFNDDLMTGDGNSTPRAADIQRINWFFDTCRDGSDPC